MIRNICSVKSAKCYVERCSNLFKLECTSQLYKSHCFCSNISSTLPVNSTITRKSIGQPTHDSHPHLLNSDEITPMIQRVEYQNRRQKLMERIVEFSWKQSTPTKNHMVIVPSASKKYMSDKIPYFFRQNTEFLYLTGCQEPDSCLVLMSNGSECFSSVLFVQGRDAHSELWDGPRVCPSTVNDFFGIDQGLPINDIENYIHSYMKSNPESRLWYDILSPSHLNVHNVILNILKARRNNMLESPKVLIDQQRMIKSPAEINLMRKSCQIASEAIISTIESSRPGISEHELFAKVDYECRMKGAEYLAYPPVVAGGKRANIIHYITNNQIVNNGEMVLMDAGCEYHGYSSDITRTFPVGGKFTDEQRQLYEAVLETQLELIEQCKKFLSLDTLFDSMCERLGKKLQEIGLIPMSVSKDALVRAAYKFCPHHVSHYLGMDVHDTPSITRNIPLRPGMIITVEPGVYVHDTNKDAPKKYRGIGIRIEDDVLITEDGPEILTKHCPKEVEILEMISSRNS